MIQVEEQPGPQEIQYPRFHPHQEYARVEQHEAAGDNWGDDGGGYHSHHSWQSLGCGGLSMSISRTVQIVPELEVAAVDAPAKVDLVSSETSTTIKAVVCEKPVLGCSRDFLAGPTGLHNDKDKAVSQEMETDVPQVRVTAVGVVQGLDLGVGAKKASAQEQDEGVVDEAVTVETQEIHPGEDQLIGVTVEALDQTDDTGVPHAWEELSHVVIEDQHDEPQECATRDLGGSEKITQCQMTKSVSSHIFKSDTGQDPEIEMSDCLLYTSPSPRD